MLNKLRKWLIKKLTKDTDGYTFTGFSEGQPIKFYYCESNNTYYMGIRSDTMYYARPTLSGWSLEMSRYLDWDALKMSEPKVINFQTWIHGILANVHAQYMNNKSNLTNINNINTFDNRH